MHRKSLSTLLHRTAAWLPAGVLAAGLTVAACHEPTDAPGTMPGDDFSNVVNYCATPQNFKYPTNADEPELFGSIFLNGAQVNCSYTISLTPVSLQGILYGGTVLSLDTDPRYGVQFGWWDPEQNGGCAATNVLAWEGSGATNNELHGSNGVTGPPWGSGGGQGLERHCIRPGRYTFTATGPLGTRSFDVDYVQATGGLVESGTGVPLYVERPYNRIGGTHDVIINVDFGSPPGGGSDSPALTAQAINPPSDPADPAISYAGSTAVTGTSNTSFRFSLHGSTWSDDITWFTGRGRILAKLFWDAAATPTDATGYYNVDAYGPRLVRVHRFPNPTTAQRVYSVALDLKRPAEAAVTTPPPGLVTVTINRIYPDLAAGTFTLPGAAVTGQVLNITVPERNLTTTANGVAEAGWQGRLYLSLNQTLEVGGDSLVGTFTEGSTIPPGGTLNPVRTITIPASLSPNNYYLLAQFDAANTVLESTAGEANNLDKSTNTISITAPILNAPTTFSVTNCYLTTVATKVYANYGVAWSATTQPVGTVYEIGEAQTNNPASAIVIRSRASTIHTDSLTNYRVISTAPPRYEWIRHKNGSSTTAWVALSQNPLQPSQGCLN